MKLQNGFNASPQNTQIKARQRWMTVMGSTFCPHFVGKTWLPHLKQGLRPDLGYSTVQSRRQSDLSQPVPTAFPLDSSHGCLDFTCEAGGQRHWCSLGAINMCLYSIHFVSKIYINNISNYRIIPMFSTGLYQKTPNPKTVRTTPAFP